MTDKVLLSALEENKIKYAENYGLKNSCTFRIGGVCRLALFPCSSEQLASCISLLDGAGERFCVIGKGSNTLFSDAYIDSVLVFTAGACEVKIDGTLVRAQAGVSLVSLCATLAEHGLSGLEFASGIPGSVGGAAFMNAGAYGGTVADVIKYTRAYDRGTGEAVTLFEHGFGYRKSIYMENRKLVCLEACFSLVADEPMRIKEKMRELAAERRKKQPLEYPSAGSYFKRPEGDFAGRLIEAAGLKGRRLGGACVSEKHAGFIVNTGDASFLDVMSLEDEVRRAVRERFGVTLEREVEVIEG